jgi:hypothetical protein
MSMLTKGLMVFNADGCSFDKGPESPIDITLVSWALALILHHSCHRRRLILAGGTSLRSAHSSLRSAKRPLGSLCISLIVSLPTLGEHISGLECGYVCGWAAGTEPHGLDQYGSLVDRKGKTSDLLHRR